MPSLKRILQSVLPLVFLVGATAVPSTSLAQGSYNNANIATNGLAHVGQVYDPGYPGSCWPFVRDMIYQASGGTQDITAQTGDYFTHLQNAGGTQITSVGQLAEGDVVQNGQYGSHTFIIVSPNGGSSFTVVDANSLGNNTNTVLEHQVTVTLSSSERAYRFGTVSPPSSGGGGGSGPTCGYDLNCDGRVNIFDLSKFLNHYGAGIPYWAPGDFNNDGAVNIFDMSALIGRYGT